MCAVWQRELWYRIKPTGLFQDPEEVNRRVLDVCAVLGEQCGGRCPREALGVIASPRGFMSGAVSLLLPDSEQLLPLDSVVYPIPGDPEECSALDFAAGSLARCVLVVEKESVFRCADTYDPRSLPTAYACQPPLRVLCVPPEAQGSLHPVPLTRNVPRTRTNLGRMGVPYRTHRLHRRSSDASSTTASCKGCPACCSPRAASRTTRHARHCGVRPTHSMCLCFVLAEKSGRLSRDRPRRASV